MQKITTPSFNPRPKSFWQKPENITSTVVLTFLVLGAGALLYWALPTLIVLAQNTLYLAIMLVALAALLYVVFDKRTRMLIAYMYKSFIRKLTGLFVTIDPIGILKNYIRDLEGNLEKMGRQIGQLRGQMRHLESLIEQNKEEIESSLRIAKKAKETQNEQQLVLHTRKAARMQETNEKYQKLLAKIEVLHKILTRMYQNSELLLADMREEVKLKEQQRKALRTSYSAMRSSMSVIKGEKEREMFDRALEAIAEDVAMKIGEMEQFMDLSENLMKSIDLQNAVLEEEGLKMLEEYEKKSRMLLMGGADKKAASDKAE